MRTLTLATLGWAGLLASASQAQSLYVFDPALAVTELSGPGVGPCGYPNGPVNSFFPVGPPPCLAPAFGPFLPPAGDVAIDPTTDIVYVTNGAMILACTAAGATIGWAFPPAPGITGLAVMAPGFLWITTGAIYGAVALAGIACPGGPVPFAIGPFPVPIGPIFAGPIGDLDWEGATGSLIGCDAFGIVGSFLPGPGPAVGPYGFFPMPPVPCPLAPGLVGIAFDKALPGSGTFFVTDGVFIQRALPGGVPAPPTFYFPGLCIPIAAALPIAGLAYAGRQITYGAGADNTALPAPVIGSIGQSYLGNPAFTVTLAGSIPGSNALLRTAFAPACPAPLVRGVPFYLAVPRFLGASGPRFLTTNVLVGAGGGAAYVTAIPPTLAPGVTFYLQWMILTPVSFQVTAGAAFTTSLP